MSFPASSLNGRMGYPVDQCGNLASTPGDGIDACRALFVRAATAFTHAPTRLEPRRGRDHYHEPVSTAWRTLVGDGQIKPAIRLSASTGGVQSPRCRSRR